MIFTSKSCIEPIRSTAVKSAANYLCIVFCIHQEMGLLGIPFIYLYRCLQHTINGEKKNNLDSKRNQAKSIDKMPMTLIKMILKTIMRANDEMNPMKLRLKSNNKTNRKKKHFELISWSTSHVGFCFSEKCLGFFIIFVYLMFDFGFWWCCAFKCNREKYLNYGLFIHSSI